MSGPDKNLAANVDKTRDELYRLYDEVTTLSKACAKATTAGRDTGVPAPRFDNMGGLTGKIFDTETCNPLLPHYAYFPFQIYRGNTGGTISIGEHDTDYAIGFPEVDEPPGLKAQMHTFQEGRRINPRDQYPLFKKATGKEPATYEDFVALSVRFILQSVTDLDQVSEKVRPVIVYSDANNRVLHWYRKETKASHVIHLYTSSAQAIAAGDATFRKNVQDLHSKLKDTKLKQDELIDKAGQLLRSPSPDTNYLTFADATPKGPQPGLKYRWYITYNGEVSMPKHTVFTPYTGDSDAGTGADAFLQTFFDKDFQDKISDSLGSNNRIIKFVEQRSHDFTNVAYRESGKFHLDTLKLPRQARWLENNEKLTYRKINDREGDLFIVLGVAHYTAPQGGACRVSLLAKAAAELNHKSLFVAFFTRNGKTLRVVRSVEHDKIMAECGTVDMDANSGQVSNHALSTSVVSHAPRIGSIKWSQVLGKIGDVLPVREGMKVRDVHVQHMPYSVAAVVSLQGQSQSPGDRLTYYIRLLYPMQDQKGSRAKRARCVGRCRCARRGPRCFQGAAATAQPANPEAPQGQPKKTPCSRVRPSTTRSVGIFRQKGMPHGYRLNGFGKSTVVAGAKLEAELPGTGVPEAPLGAGLPGIGDTEARSPGAGRPDIKGLCQKLMSSAFTPLHGVLEMETW